MASRINICVDLRREPNCGVGKIAFNVASLFLELKGTLGIDVSGLIFPEQKTLISKRFPGIAIIETNARFLSSEDLLQLPQHLSSAADVFWTSQFYVSPFFTIPVVSTIHDTWAAMSPEWLPNHEEVIRRYGSGAIDMAHQLVSHFEITYRSSMPPELARIYAQRDSILDKYMLAMMYMCAVKSLLIVTVSEYSRQQIMALMPICANKIHLLSPFANDRQPIRKPNPKIDRILMVAKLDPRKNHRLVLDALEELFTLRRFANPIEVHFVGEIGYRSFGKSLVDAGLRISTTTQRITFHDLIPDYALSRLYTESDLLLLPSLNEGFGLPVLEALEIGMPVLAAVRGALSEVGRHFIGYCRVESPAMLAADINSALNCKKAMTKMASAGQLDVRVRYSRNRALEQLRTILSVTIERMGKLPNSND